MFSKKLFCLLLLSISMSFACASPRFNSPDKTFYPENIPYYEAEYKLGPGDVLEIIYHLEQKPAIEEYTIAVGDRIVVEFYYHPDNNREVLVRPDHKITLPRQNDIVAVGLTPSELRQHITKQYSHIFREPIVTVTLVEYNRPLNDLIASISTGAQGQSKYSTIRPDGFISFPFLSDIYGAGLTMHELQNEVDRRYGEFVNGLRVSLVLNTLNSNIVYVMGEVQNPDIYLMQGPTTLTQMLARAGGPLNSARLDNVLVVNQKNQGKAQGRIVNVKEILKGSEDEWDIRLQQYDVVYVPRTSVANTGLFIDQYINKIIPQIFRFNVN